MFLFTILAVCMFAAVFARPDFGGFGQQFQKFAKPYVDDFDKLDETTKLRLYMIFANMMELSQNQIKAQIDQLLANNPTVKADMDNIFSAMEKQQKTAYDTYVNSLSGSQKTDAQTFVSNVLDNLDTTMMQKCTAMINYYDNLDSATQAVFAKDFKFDIEKMKAELNGALKNPNIAKLAASSGVTSVDDKNLCNVAEQIMQALVQYVQSRLDGTTAGRPNGGAPAS